MGCVGSCIVRPASPVPTEIDNYARAKLIVRTALMHASETEAVERDAPPLDLALELTGG